MKLFAGLSALLLLGQWVCLTRGARILALTPSCSKSHKISFMPFVEGLAAKGHQVTIVSPHPSKQRVDNVREIVVDGDWDNEKLDWFKMIDRDPLTSLRDQGADYLSMMIKGYKAVQESDELKEILQTGDVDLIIVDAVLNEFILPIIDHLQVPWIYYCPPSVFPWHLEVMGVDLQAASIPSGGQEGVDQQRLTTNFFSRLVNFAGMWTFIFLRKVKVLGALDDLIKQDYPHARPIAEIEREAQLSIINYHPATAWPRPFPPTFIPIGPLHTRPAQLLPKELQILADGAKDGFIVFTLGSEIPVSSMPPHFLDMFIRVFARIPQLVFWKWEKKDDAIKGILSSNVKTLDWLPQQDLLGHQNARLFISHGGLLGIQEAVYHGVPYLGLPFGNDQFGNMAKACEEGYTIKLRWKDLNDSLLYDSIQNLIHQPSFKGNATRLSNLMKDELVPSKDLAVYWVEHVLRHGGTKHLQPSAKDMPFYQRYLFDVSAFLLFLSCLSLFLTYRSISWMISKCFRRPQLAKLKGN